MRSTRWAACVGLLLSAALIGFGCGDDGNDDENGGDTATYEPPGAEDEAALQEEIADLPDKEQIMRLGAAFAERISQEDQRMCAFAHPDSITGEALCVSYTEDFAPNLESGSKVRTVALRGEKSFPGDQPSRVEAVAIFDNGEQIRWSRDPEGRWKVIFPL